MAKSAPNKKGLNERCSESDAIGSAHCIRSLTQILRSSSNWYWAKLP